MIKKKLRKKIKFWGAKNVKKVIVQFLVKIASFEHFFFQHHNLIFSKITKFRKIETSLFCSCVFQNFDVDFYHPYESINL